MVNDTYKKIGDRVKHYRTNRGLSQEQLADGICSRQTISLLENGQHFPSADFMKQIAARLAVPFHEIMVDEEKELEARVQLDIIKVYVEIGDYADALPLIEQLDDREDLLEYQRRDLILSKAECLMRTEKADLAVACLTRLQKELEHTRDSDSRLLVNVYNKLGSAFFFMSNMPYAHANYQRAYNLSLSFEKYDTLSATVSYNLANVCKWFGMYSEAILHFKNSYEYFKQVSDSQRLAHTLFELGLSYSRVGNFEASKEFLEQALAIYQSHNMLSMIRRLKQQYAFRVLAVDDPTEAIGEILQCAKEYGAEGDVIREAYLYARATILYLEQGNTSEAGNYISQAIQLVSDIDNDPKVPYIFRVYSLYLLKTDDCENAINFAYKSSDLFDMMGLSNESADSLQVAVDAYRLMGDKEGVIDSLEKMNRQLRSSSQHPFFKISGDEF